MKVTILTLFATLTLQTSNAFVPQRRPQVARLLTQLAETTAEKHMERAVKCAERFGLCNIDELMDLADGTCMY